MEIKQLSRRKAVLTFTAMTSNGTVLENFSVKWIRWIFYSSRNHDFIPKINGTNVLQKSSLF